MKNLRPSNIKVIFQRPSCGSPIAVASGFSAGTAAVGRVDVEKIGLSESLKYENSIIL